MDDELSAFLERVRTNVLSGDSNMFALDPERKKVIESLPTITEEQLISLDHKDSNCPICYTSFLAVLASEEMAHAMESPAVSFEDLGVTRLADTCGHLFCRKDITTWIRQNNTCPTCRTPFIVVPESSHTTEPFVIGIDAQEATLEQFQNLEESTDVSEQSRLQLERLFNRAFNSGVFTFTPEQRDERGVGSESHTGTAEEDDRSEFSSMYS